MTTARGADRSVSRRRLLFPVLVVLPAFAVLVGLGAWQLQRMAWKDALIAGREAADAAPPLADLRAVEATRDAFRRATASGRFLHDREMYLTGRVWRRQAGWAVVTPLELADGGVLLVERGWVPQDRRDPATRPAGQIAGPVMLTGRVLAPAAGNLFTPDNDPAGNNWYRRDVAEMAAATGLSGVLPWMLALDGAPPTGGLPVSGEVRPAPQNNHLQYAVTWFGLAAALLVIAGVWYRQAGATGATGRRPQEEGK